MDGIDEAIYEKQTARIAELEAQLDIKTDRIEELSMQLEERNTVYAMAHVRCTEQDHDGLRPCRECIDWMAQAELRAAEEATRAEEREQCMADVCPRCRNHEPVRWWGPPTGGEWVHLNPDNGYTSVSCRADAIRQRAERKADG